MRTKTSVACDRWISEDVLVWLYEKLNTLTVTDEFTDFSLAFIYDYDWFKSRITGCVIQKPSLEQIHFAITVSCSFRDEGTICHITENRFIFALTLKVLHHFREILLDTLNLIIY